MTKEKQKVPAQPPVESDSTAQTDERAETERQMKRGSVTAQLMTRPSFMAAHTAMSFVPESMKAYGPANMVSMFEQFHADVKKVVEGDMTTPEALLISQAMSLSSIYNECASQAALNLGTRSGLPAAEALMRMALKAQAQCTQTLRVLGELKNPRVPATFVKQQNNATGNQQVNNAPVTQGATAHAHGEKETSVTTNELLTDDREAQDAATLDTGTTGGASPENQTLETVGAVNRAGD